MQFIIGTRVYSVRRQWNLTCDGERLDGLCAYSSHTIWLDGDLSEEVIVEVLRHEHQHSWEAETCIPHTAEDRANLTATVGAAFDAEFTAQGGLAALLEIPIEGLRPEVKRNKAEVSFNISDRRNCGTCGCEVMVGSIDTAEARMVESVGMYMLERGFECPACGSVQVWDEQCTRDGIPLGKFFNPRILSGVEAGEWLGSHRELCTPYVT
jgi:hypothetical protein